MSRSVTVACPTCGEEVEMSVHRELFGADADGNRGEWRDEAEVYSVRCACEWTDAEYEQMVAEAIEASYEDEADFYGLEV